MEGREGGKEKTAAAVAAAAEGEMEKKVNGVGRGVSAVSLNGLVSAERAAANNGGRSFFIKTKVGQWKSALSTLERGQA